ncbi:MAG: hypothetical protein JWO43_648 [Candidatus Adlerbacteria bacterium]|nr:hypothetical protein [Candidatus Adlerbacteria bacterium]
MDPKQQALEQIRAIAAQHGITQEDLSNPHTPGVPTPAPVVVTPSITPSEFHHVGIAEVIYYIGGAIVCVGIGIFVYQNWNTLAFPTKMMATLGAAIAAYIVGVLFGSKPSLEGPSNAFYLISAIVMPIGLFVVFDNAHMNIGSSGVQAVISAILFVMYTASYTIFRKPVFMLFSIIFGTWLFNSSTSYLLDQNAAIDPQKFTQYRALASGAAYILLGMSFAKGKLAPLSGALYGFGSLGFLGAALALGGWQPRQDMLWELMYPVFVFGILYLSVYMKSKSFLTFGTIFLMVYIFKITAEYFTEGLGWPLSLVIAGLLMIGVGYTSVTLNKKYIKTV